MWERGGRTVAATGVGGGAAIHVACGQLGKRIPRRARVSGGLHVHVALCSPVQGELSPELSRYPQKLKSYPQEELYVGLYGPS